MTRRANNEGSIYRDKKGNWRGSVTLYTANGKPKKKYFYGRTKKEVADKVNRTLNEIRNHTYIEPNSMTLAEWLRIWLDTYCRNTLRPSTFVNYEIYLDKHITPTIGNIRLTDLNAVVLQQFYNDKPDSAKLNRPSTIQNSVNMVK